MEITSEMCVHHRDLLCGFRDGYKLKPGNPGLMILAFQETHLLLYKKKKILDLKPLKRNIQNVRWMTTLSTLNCLLQDYSKTALGSSLKHKSIVKAFRLSLEARLLLM